MSGRLNLGCGPQKKSGYVNVDASASVRPDVVADASRLPFADNSVEAIEAYHLIEHLYPWDAEKAIAEWRRVLSPGGVLALECPDISKAMEWIVKHREFTPFAAMGFRALFGEAPSREPLMMHRWGYTPQTLTSMLAAAGFDPVMAMAPQTHHPWRDMRIEATKPKSPATTAPTRPLEVFWFPYGNRQVASARLQVFLIHDHLLKHGVQSTVLIEPPIPLFDMPWQPWWELWRPPAVVRGGIAIVQHHFGPGTLEMVALLRSTGSPIVYVQANYSEVLEVHRACDVLVCPSEELADHFRAAGVSEVLCIPDPAEFHCEARSAQRQCNAERGLRLAWLGSASHWDGLAVLREVLAEPEFHDLMLITVSDHVLADVPWSPGAMQRALASADIGVLPAGSGPLDRYKSSNRAVAMMAAGLPVIAGPIRAYREVVEEGRTGFLASEPEEWRAALRALRDPQKRLRMAEQGYQRAFEEFSVDRIAAHWSHLLERLNRVPRPSWMHAPCSEAERRTAIALLKSDACFALARTVAREGSYRLAMNEVLRGSALRLGADARFTRRVARAVSLVAEGTALTARVVVRRILRAVRYS